MQSADQAVQQESSLLLELCVPFRLHGSGLQVEMQALNGMRLWAKHFDRVTICAPQQPTGYVDGSSIVWADPAELLASGRVTFEPMPWAYHPRDHFRHRSAVFRRFHELVAKHKYLCFSNLGVFGAWGNLGVLAAQQQRRPYSLWFDWVLHEMSASEGASPKARIRGKIYSVLIKHVTYKAIRRCSLGLFHGKTVYDAYAPICKKPALVHDIHVHPGDAITDEDLERRLASLDRRETIRLGYVGRVHPMKAPLQWIDAVAKVVRTFDKGRIKAVWLGDGPQLDEARAKVRDLGMEDSICFDGFISDRGKVLAFLKSLDLFVFTHITPESPRSLIEALISGLPLVGYESSYAHELVGERGGALLSFKGDANALAATLIGLVGDMGAVVKLSRAAATARPIYNDEAVFAHRSDLIKRFL